MPNGYKLNKSNIYHLILRHGLLTQKLLFAIKYAFLTSCKALSDYLQHLRGEKSLAKCTKIRKPILI